MQFPSLQIRPCDCKVANVGQWRNANTLREVLDCLADAALRGELREDSGVPGRLQSSFDLKQSSRVPALQVLAP